MVRNPEHRQLEVFEQAQAFAAALAAAETTAGTAQALAAALAAAEAAPGARDRARIAQASSAVGMRRSAAGNSAVSTITEAGVGVIGRQRTARHATTGEFAGAVRKLGAGDDGRDRACDCTRGAGYRSAEAHGTAADNGRSYAGLCKQLMPAVCPAAAAGDKASRTTRGIKRAVAGTVTRSGTPSAASAHTGAVAIAQPTEAVVAFAANRAALTDEPVHRSGDFADALVGVGDVILGVVAVRNRERLVLLPGRKIVRRNHSGQDVRAEESICAG